MGQSLFDKIQAKLELFRLEKRYTRSRHRRSAFVSNAVYVDGEYVYQTPNSTGSSTDGSSTGVDALHGEKASASAAPRTTSVPVLPEVDEERDTAGGWPSHGSNTDEQATPQRKKLNRYSSMPGFGGSRNADMAPSRPQRRLSMLR